MVRSCVLHLYSTHICTVRSMCQLQLQKLLFTIIMHSHKVFTEKEREKETHMLHKRSDSAETTSSHLHRVSFGSFINSYQLSHPFNLHIDGFFVLLLWLALLSSVAVAGAHLYPITMYMYEACECKQNFMRLTHRRAHTHIYIEYIIMQRVK